MENSERVPGRLQGIALLLPCTMAVMAVVALTAVVPMMTEHFKYVPNADVLVPMVPVLPSLFFFLFAPVAGWVADRVGRRALLIGGLVLYGIVGVVPTFIDDLTWILFSRALVGIGEAIILTVSTTIICDYWKGSARERWIAGQTAVSQVAAIVIAFAGGVMGSIFGWFGPFYLYLSSWLLALGVWAFTWEPVRGDSVEEAKQDDSAVLYQTMPWARMLGICGISVLASVMFFSILVHNGTALGAFGIKEASKIGLVTSIAAIGSIVGAFVYWRAASLATQTLLCIEFLIIGIGYTTMSQASSAEAYAVATFFCNIGLGMILPTLMVWAARGLSYRIRGRGNGMWQSAFLVGQFVAGGSLPLLAREVNGMLPAFKVVGYVALALAAGALVARFMMDNASAALKSEAPTT
jgi:MFS family permease